MFTGENPTLSCKDDSVQNRQQNGETIGEELDGDPSPRTLSVESGDDLVFQTGE